MKRNLCCALLLILSGIFISLGLISCKATARLALKYWTKKQVREFVSGCEDKTKSLLGEEKAKKYCDCAVDVVAEKYQDYQQIKNISILDILKIANDCK